MTVNHAGTVPSALAHVLSPMPSAQTSTVCSWPGYCLWRGLPLSSPAPVALASALTLWYHSFPAVLAMECAADARMPREVKVVRVAVIGADVEVPLAAAFVELLALWPAATRIEIAFVGPHVKQSVHGQSREWISNANGTVTACSAGGAK